MDMKDFLNVLASKEPVPGGGGACGYVAAVGMALGNMVLSLTTGKKKYAEYQEEIEELIVKAGDITNRLYECMDKDAKAFKPLSEAYGLPKDTEEQLEHRNKVMENALLIASEAPLSMMELIVEAIKLIDRISVIGSRLAISDAGVGVQMCKAALNGASLNVYINTKLMKNIDVAEDMNTKADELVITGNELAANLHAGCVELFVGKNAKLRYSTIENWSKNMYNLNTKRAIVEEGGTIEWVSIELFNSLNKTEVTFLNKVKELHSSSNITFCNTYNKT